MAGIVCDGHCAQPFFLVHCFTMDEGICAPILLIGKYKAEYLANRDLVILRVVLFLFPRRFVILVFFFFLV